MKIILFTMSLLLSFQSFSKDQKIIDRILGNFHLNKVTKTGNLKRRSLKKSCPTQIQISLLNSEQEVKVSDQSSGEIFNLMKLGAQRRKIDDSIWLETKTSVSDRVLTKRSRHCSGFFGQRCTDSIFRPELSILEKGDSLVFNVYDEGHNLRHKCYYQRPNEVGF